MCDGSFLVVLIELGPISLDLIPQDYVAKQVSRYCKTLPRPQGEPLGTTLAIAGLPKFIRILRI